ncbi:serine/threonine-protein kinase [uncultured Erythrobacter sp.]|uniref:serine/threonine-protein kinase n=1 Tax=uncultured Erythrobacter sp. TaxID=263913 RepID=UPI00262C0515|nr:serine/threonine-protein kinase [uncultured Erythrobacter sp.]
MTKCSKCDHENAGGAQFCGQCGASLKQETVGDITPELDSMQTVGMFETVGRGDKAISKELEFGEGDVFAGRYTVQSLIGRGGMGVVYKAVDRHGEREVALKLIRPDLLSGAEAVKRLIAEGVTTQELAHPNIVRVYNVDEADNVPYVAMEYVGGTTLGEWHRARIANREQVPVRVAARIIMELLAGLEAAHAAGIIHRDLKPQNIILTAEPDEKNASIKILDFGIARVAGAEESLGGTALGTAAYMAPEQRTDPDLVDTSADLFALSKIFYKLLMDALPDTMWQPPSASRSEVPEEVDALILSGISVNRNDRPQSVDEFRTRLLAAMNSKPGTRRNPNNTIQKLHDSGGEDSGKTGLASITESPMKMAGIGCFGALALVVIFIANLPPVPDDEYPPPPPPPPESPYARLAGDWYSELSGEAEPFAISADGSFQASGMDETYNVPFTVSGQFVGNNATYQYQSQLGVFQGTLTWNGSDCHVDNSLNVAGQIVTDRYHINHLPGEPCPAGF